MNTTNVCQRKPRRYLDDHLDIGQWSQVRCELEKILTAPIDSAAEWIALAEKSGELEMAVLSECLQRLVKMKCHTDNPQYREDSMSYNREVVAPVEKYRHRIYQKLDASSYKQNLPDRYRMFQAIIAREMSVFHEDNVALGVEEDKLCVDYQQIRAGQIVNYRGQNKTLPQLSALEHDPDREVREEAWTSSRSKLASDYFAINAVFDKMLLVRNRMATNAGFANYRDFAHQRKWRFGYTPDDVLGFHDAVEKVVVPLLRKIRREKANDLGVKSLRPWDNYAEKHTIPLRPFDDTADLLDKFARLLDGLDPEMLPLFEKMRASGFFDLESRPGKDPGAGFCAPLFCYDACFIIMNAAGIHRDMVTLAHEYGHALHLSATADETLLPYILHPAEVGELASKGMEALSLPHWRIFYPRENDYRRAMRSHFIRAVEGFVSTVIIDAFQHWLYTAHGHGPEERAHYFGQLQRHFDPEVDWHGLEQYQGIGWVRIPHIFRDPFYMIEYSFSSLGSLALYRNYLQHPQKTLAEYRRFLRHGYSLPTRQLYELAGIRFDFSEDYLREMTAFIEDILK